MQDGIGKLHKVAGKFLIVGVVLLAMAGCGGSSSSSGSSNQTATPAFSPGGGTYTGSKPITISDATPGAVLYCTTDGTTPTTSSPQCSQPTTVFKSEFLQAIAVAPNMSPSAVASAGYTIGFNSVATPTFMPAGGTYTSVQTVAIGDTTSGANIYYTTDGSAPVPPSSTTTTTAKLYTGAVTVAASETLNAIATASGYDDSIVASANYTISVSSVPTITGLSPASATAGGAAFTLTVNGTNFVPGSMVQWAGTALTTTFVSATQITAAVPANLIATASSANVTVTGPGGVSAGAAFTISPAILAPTIASLSPSSATAGSAAFTLTINGANFDSGTTVQWGTTALARTFVSATQLTAVVPASLIAASGSASVTVTSSGGTSSGATFTINAVPPTITSLSPSSATAGGAAFTLTVNGMNFVSGTTVQWNGTAVTTTFVSATQLTAAIPASLIATAGSESVTVADAGGTSSAAAFTVNSALPTISGFSPATVNAGGAAFTLTVTGTNFVSGATVQWNATGLTTTFVSATQLTAEVPANLIATTGSASVTVKDAAGTSTAATYTISAPNAPTISSLSPSSAMAGGTAFTLTVNGMNFNSSATVEWGNTALTTTSVSATQLTAAVPPSLIATAGSVNVTVADAGLTSVAAIFTINAVPPTITTLSPASAAPGGPAFTLTVNGANFDSSASVKWNSTALSTMFLSATQLTAVVPANLIATAGSASVTVTTTAGGPSSAATFNIVATLTGTVLSGALPIAGATVQLYAAGTSGYGAGSSALTTVPATLTTDSSGKFSLQYACPALGAPGDQMYLVATGGDSGSGPNSSIALMAALGTCSKLPSFVTVNEVTTVASAYALSAFATVNTSGGGIAVGAPTSGSACNAAGGWVSTHPNTCNYTGLVNAFNAVNNLVSISTGTALTNTPAYPTNLAGDPNILNNSTVPTTRIDALADMLASCVESSGSTCSGDLFTAAQPSGGTQPDDTLQAALDIAQNPGNNVSTLLGLVSSMTPPPYSIGVGANTLLLSGTGAPTDLTLALTFTGAGLGIAPGLTLSDGVGGVVNAGLGIDGAGNVWVAAYLYNPSMFVGNGEMIAEFNALGGPVTQATQLSSDPTPVPTYGGYNPQPGSTSGIQMNMLAIDQSENLWTYENGFSGNTQNVLEISTSPNLSVLNTVPAPQVNAVAIDASGDAWFVTNSNNLIELQGNGKPGITGGALSGYSDLSYSTFDSNGGLWTVGISPSFGLDVLQLSTSDGSLVYDAFPSSTSDVAARPSLVADGLGNVYGCDPTGSNLDVFNAGVLVQSYPITNQRACGTQLVIDGQGHIFSVLDGVFNQLSGRFFGNIDEFTAKGTLISPQANGYTGSSSTEAPTLNPDLLFTSDTVPGVSAAIDGSGNLWVLNTDTDGTNTSNFNILPGNVLVEYIGIGAPVLTPAATALTNGMLGARP